MSEAPGPEVPSGEDLYRGLTTNAWWVAEEKRPSSAAFTFPSFSVDVASLAGGPEHTLGHLPAGSGLVAFNCGAARALGFDARLEPDPQHPENAAHANVYCSLPTSQRKKRAQQLVGLCQVIREPKFGS
jgi:hypothetical protein